MKTDIAFWIIPLLFLSVGIAVFALTSKEDLKKKSQLLDQIKAKKLYDKQNGSDNK